MTSSLGSDTCILRVLDLSHNKLGAWTAVEVHKSVIESACTTNVLVEGNSKFPEVIRHEVNLYQQVVKHFSQGAG